MPVKDVLKSWITWPLLGAAVIGLASVAIAWPIGRGDQAARRWKSGTVTEHDAFKQLADPSTYPATPTPDGPIAPPVPNWYQPHVAVYSVPTISPPHPRPTLRDLADEGQAHAIDFLGQKSPSVSHAWADLQKALTDDGDAGSKDPYKFDRVLVATIAKGANWAPGHRMMWTRVFVQPINFRFAGYSVAATENETLKVSSVETTKTQKFSADLGLALLGSEGPKASIGPSNERTVKTTADVNTQYERLGIDIMPSFLRIIRESETGGNVVGNTEVSLSIVTDPDMIWKKFPADPRKRPPGDDLALVVTGLHLQDGAAELVPNEASISVLPQVPLPHCALRARVWMLYEHRAVSKGQEYYDESQQDVVLERDADEKQDIEVMAADDVSPAVWSIQILPNTNQTDSTAPVLVSAHVGKGLPRELVFTDYGQASTFAHWIRTHPDAKIQSLAFNYTDGSSVVPVKKKDDACDDGYDRGKYKVVDRATLNIP